MAPPTIEPNGGAVVFGCPFAGSRSADRPRPAAAPPLATSPAVVRDLPTDPLGLARVVTRAVRERGKHVLSASLREVIRAPDDRTPAFRRIPSAPSSPTEC